jgi:glycosyltransferase involved in cell wall biosynthesis
MKIGMLVNNLEVSGGYQKLVLRLALNLERVGHQVIIFTPLINKKACYPDLIKNLDIVSLHRDEGSKGPLNSFLLIANKIPSNIDALIIHDELSLIAIGSLNRLPRKIVWMLNNQYPENLGKYGVEIKSVYQQTIGTKQDKLREAKMAYQRIRLIRRGLSRITDFVTYDNFNKDLVAKKLKRAATVVLAGADLEQFIELSHDRDFDRQKNYTFLSVGVVFPHRRYEDFIDAINLLVKQGESVKGIIVGRQDLSKNYSDALKAKISQLKLENNVFMKEYVPEKEMLKLYKNADGFVFINDGFTWGISVFEAVAAGLPSIITNNIGAADLIKHGRTGWVVGAKNPTQVASAMRDIIHSRGKAKIIAMRAKKELTPLVSWDAYTRRMLRVIEENK